jgi:hypothetical protein
LITPQTASSAENIALPFAARELAEASPAAIALFRAKFATDPPDCPRHFVALAPGDHAVCGYIHFRYFEPEVYLCGGLCIDERIYRRLPQDVRARIKGVGSLSRWLSDTAIGMLGPKRAILAYTGHLSSRRDALALGFEETSYPYVLVQWHSEPPSERPALLARVARNGPF